MHRTYLWKRFQSHGYDTRAYFHVDPRLGSDKDLEKLVIRAHDIGLRVVIDGVYNHVGRGFWAFQRLKEEGPISGYRDWFRDVSFERDNRLDARWTYNFADNHDVSRLTSELYDTNQIFPIYGLLWTMPGIPSVYYGSEYGITGNKDDGDAALRPPRNELERWRDRGEEIADFLRRLNEIRRASVPLRYGAYRQLSVTVEHLLFERFTEDETVVVGINIGENPIAVSGVTQGVYKCLFSGEEVTVENNSPLEIPGFGTTIVRR